MAQQPHGPLRSFGRIKGRPVKPRQAALVETLLPRLHKRYVTYGFSPQATFCAAEVRSEDGVTGFDVCRQGTRLGRLQVRLLGRHNVLNALASVAVAEEVGVPFATTACCPGR